MVSPATGRKGDNTPVRNKRGFVINFTSEAKMIQSLSKWPDSVVLCRPLADVFDSETWSEGGGAIVFAANYTDFLGMMGLKAPVHPVTMRDSSKRRR